jgi:hypothetical protein
MKIYRGRIMLDVDGTAIELKRFDRPVNPSDIRYWLEDREDRGWVEYPLTDKQTITPRWAAPRGDKTNKMRLSHEEMSGAVLQSELAQLP